MIGQRLGHHRILEKLGAGGMGAVYRAYDERLERDVALKVLHTGALADDAARRRFRKEALALSRLNHPNIETVHEFDTEEGVDFLVMECIGGTTLTDRLAHGPVPERELLHLATQLAEGLAAAHDQGVVHRDLKPGNLRVTPEGRLKILDFGLARLLAPGSAVGAVTTESVTESMAGTLPYMAPEQLRGDAVDHRSDLWATGVVLYEMATGRRPFAAALVTAIAADIQTKPPPRPSEIHRVSPGLEHIILKCLEKDPDLRYQSARDLLADLRRLTAGGSGEVRPAPRRIGRRSSIAIGGMGIAAAAVLWLNGIVPHRRPAAPPAPPSRIESLAVLPLANLSADAGQDFIVDAIHEALITEFSKIRALRVISRTSTLPYKQGGKALGQIAKDLDVDAVVEGSVLRSGDRLRVSATLMQVNPERSIWTDHFDHDLKDVLNLTSEVATAVAGRIRVVLTPAEETSLARRRQVNPDAYELYALGRHHWNQRTLASYKRAVDTFERALDLDPGYASAYAALADCYILLGEQGGLPQQEARAEAERAIRKALELDEHLAEAHTSLARWRFAYGWDWPGAEASYRRAIELNPNYAPAHQLYGRTLAFVGRFDEAIEELREAKRLDPLSITINAYMGQVYMFAGDNDGAAAQLARTLDLDPNHALTRHNLGELYLAQKRFGEAIVQLEMSVKSSSEPSAHYMAILGCAYARGNRRADALRTLAMLTERSTRGLVSAFDMAALHAALGQRAQSLEWLEQGFARKDCWLPELKAWPWFDSLKPDPRFQLLMAQLDFEK